MRFVRCSKRGREPARCRRRRGRQRPPVSRRRIGHRPDTSLKGNAMYNATEQFAEINKTNVAQATKLAALAIENAEKLAKLNLPPPSRRSRRASKARRPSRRSRTCRNCSRCAPSSPKSGVQTAMGYSRSLYELATEAQAAVLGAGRRSVGRLHEGRRRVGREGQQVRAGRLGRRRQRVQVDVRRVDRRVRPVPEGDQAGREPGRRERPRRRRQRDQGPQGRVVATTPARARAASPRRERQAWRAACARRRPPESRPGPRDGRGTRFRCRSAAWTRLEYGV